MLLRPKNVKPILITILIVLLLLTTACSALSQKTVLMSTPENLPDAAPLPTLMAEDYPSVDGSTSTLPLETVIACRALGVTCQWVDNWLDGMKTVLPDLTNFTGSFPSIAHNGTHGAYVNLIERDADLILVARLPSQDELALAAKQGVALDARAIAVDAFVFVLNAKNPVDSLTLEEIQGIYTGKITNWNTLGGGEAAVQPYQRNDNSGSQELMKSLVMKDLSMIDAPEMVLPTMMGILYAIADDQYGIGYSVFYFETFMAPNEELKLSGVNGVLPTFESIQSREYPFTTEVYAVVRGDLELNSAAYGLRDWLLSAEGQQVVEESGYVPIR